MSVTVKKFSNRREGTSCDGCSNVPDKLWEILGDNPLATGSVFCDKCLIELNKKITKKVSNGQDS